MALFQYKPLDLEGPSFRLLRLLKGKGFDQIQCELIQERLYAGESGIPYEALSYTWGPIDEMGVIMVDKKVVRVTHNLYVALDYLRLEDHDRIMWIDAVCIDQSNVKERGHQVQNMTAIYKGAERVIIWLGEPTPETNLAMDSAIRLHKNILKNPKGRSWDQDDVYWRESWHNIQVVSDLAREEVEASQRHGVATLLDRPWFRRVWILQEVASARFATVACGTRSIPARIFSQLPRLVGVALEPHSEAVLDIFPGPARERSWWNEKRDLYTLLLKFRNSEATDKRDRIYALLGISSDACDTDMLLADYSKSTRKVLEHTLRFILGIYQCPIPSWKMQEFLQNLDALHVRLFEWAMSTAQWSVVHLVLNQKVSGTPHQRLKWGDIQVTEQMAKQIISSCGLPIVSLLIDQQGTNTWITNQVLKAADMVADGPHHSDTQLLIDRLSHGTVSASDLLQAAVVSRNLKLIPLVLGRFGPETITQEVLKQAIMKGLAGYEIMQIFLGWQNVQLPIDIEVLGIAAETGWFAYREMIKTIYQLQEPGGIITDEGKERLRQEYNQLIPQGYSSVSLV